MTGRIIQSGPPGMRLYSRYPPEPGLDEPEAAIYGRCETCGGELYTRCEAVDRLCPFCREWDTPLREGVFAGVAGRLTPPIP